MRLLVCFGFNGTPDGVVAAWATGGQNDRSTINRAAQRQCVIARDGIFFDSVQSRAER